jgi:hypothetical protein
MSPVFAATYLKIDSQHPSDLRLNSKTLIRVDAADFAKVTAQGIIGVIAELHKHRIIKLSC